MKYTVRVWRQANPTSPGRLTEYSVDDITPDMSFLEMLDALNEQLLLADDDPIAFDHDCREGICGACGIMINGTPHGPRAATTTCQLHMREFDPRKPITIEPWRARPFPVIRDLIVDRSSFDRIIESAGHVGVRPGAAPDAHAVPVPKPAADHAFTAATCIGCGACVAACPNGSAMLFTAAKVAHLAALPPGQPERATRALTMLTTQDDLGFGGCTQVGACTTACPQGIDTDVIALLNRDVLWDVTS